MLRLNTRGLSYVHAAQATTPSDSMMFCQVLSCSVSFFCTLDLVYSARRLRAFFWVADLVYCMRLANLRETKKNPPLIIHRQCGFMEAVNYVGTNFCGAGASATNYSHLLGLLTAVQQPHVECTFAAIIKGPVSTVRECPENTAQL